MKSTMLKLSMVLLPFLLSSSRVLAQHRKLTSAINPGCGELCKDLPGSLIHVKASGSNDTVHHVWDFFEKPTVFLALTLDESNFSVNWTRFLDHKDQAWEFTSSPEYVFAVVIDEVIEYNDENDTAIYDPSAKGAKLVMPSETFNWTHLETNHNEDTDEIVSTLKGSISKGNATEDSGHILVKVSAYGSMQHGNTTPHLFHTTNSSQVDLVFDNMPSSYNHSRYALKLALFNTNEDPTLVQTKTKRVDDEHSPGVFTVAEVLTTDKEDYSGYMQWRTVAYKSNDRIMTKSTELSDSLAKAIDKPSKAFKHSGAFAYFGKELDNTPANSIIINFGEKEDGFYGSTHYLTWTFLTGIGKPVEESFSLLVWIILGVGLGLPAILVVISTGCIVCRRISRTRDQLLASH